MTYAASRGEASELVVEATEARVSPAEARVELEGVRARVGAAARGEGALGSLGGLELSCERGTLRLDTRDFVADGRVQGHTGDGREFRTESLRYQHDRGLVATDSPVWIREAAGSYRGDGFRYWVRENRFRLLGAKVVRGEP